MTQFNDKLLKANLSDLRKREEEKLVQALAPQYGFEYINLNGVTINPEALLLIPETKAREVKVVAFDISHNLVKVAVKQPNSPATIQLLNSIQNDRRTIQVFMCSEDSLEHAYTRYADVINASKSKKGVFDIDEQNILSFSQKLKNPTDVADALATVGTINNSRRVTETLELMLAGALGLRASDIHIEPEEKAVRLRYRLDGVLRDIFAIDNYIYDRLLSRLKLLSGMTLNKKREAQDGRFTFSVGEREIDVRSSLIPGAVGDSLVMRLLDSSVAGFTLDRIQLNPVLKKVMEFELKKPNGLILTTGPTGSGKTTALYAFLQETHKEGTKIITIENPVEYKIEGIVQTQTSEDYTFASGLRAVLRQDPDVIMVGEIRDREVAETAIHAAQTGHLVFSTLHSNSAAAGFPRLIDLGVDPRALGTALNVMLGQRLVRVLCKECRESHEANPEESALIRQIMADHPAHPDLSAPITIWKAKGCEICGNTGYKGRLAIYEAILMDVKVENILVSDPREHCILEAAKEQGIPTMVQDGVDKVIQGVTDLEELGRVIEIPKLKEATEQKENVPDDEDLFLSHIVS